MTTQDLIHRFESEGEAARAPSNHPLSITDPKRVWLMEAGIADLFFEPLEKGLAAGSRIHLCRLAAGSLVFGIEPMESGRIILVTDASGGSLRSLPRDRFGLPSGQETTGEDPRTAGVDQWIQGLVSAIAPTIPPKDQTAIAPGQTIALAPGAAAHSKAGLIWLTSGTPPGDAIVGLDDFTISGEWPLPLPLHGWVQARSATAVTAIATAALLRADPELAFLDHYHQIYLRHLRSRWEASLIEERGRLAQKAEAFRGSFLEASASLAGLLNKAAEIHPPAGIDPLFSACAMAGRSMGLEMKPYRSLNQGQSIGDPMQAIASASGVRSRQVLLRGKWWRQDNGPLVGALEATDRPVALIPDSPVRYDMIDPVEGSRIRVDEQVAKKLKPAAVMFYRPLPAVPLKLRDLIRFGSFRLGGDVLRVGLLGAAVGLLGILPPVITGVLFDSVIPSGQRGRLIEVISLLIAGALAAGAFQFSERIGLIRIEGRLDGELQAAVWDRLLSLPVPFFRQFSAGDLATRSLAISMIRQLLTGPTLTVTLLTVFSVFNFALLFYYDAGLALWTAGIIAGTVAVMMLTAYSALRYQRTSQELKQRIAGRVLQFLSGIAKLRVSGSEPAAYAVWAREFARQRRLDFKATNINNWFAAFNSALPVLALTILYWRAGLHLKVADIPTGDFLAFASAFISLLTTISAMSTVLLNVLNAIPIYENVRPILQTVPEVDLGKAVPGELSGDIEVNDIHFRYSADGPLALKGVSFQARPGEFVALVGPSGSGKSTLFRLLLGFETPESGTVLYDRQDLAGLDLVAVRRQIGVVLQNGKLVPGDVFRNIAGTSSEHTLEDAWEAARMAGLDEDIRRMPMGMSTLIIEQGGAFSGGQRQRLLIARALINRPRILLMDEATSALDNRTQAIVSESLRQLQGTRIVIAHRLSTVVQADRIYVVKDGIITESGTYQELMDKQGDFFSLAQRQLT